MLRLIDGGVPFRELDLLTSKPLLYCANVLEKDAARVPSVDAGGHLGELVRLAEASKASVVVISGPVEAEIAQLSPEERKPFLEEIGLKQSGLERLALAGYKLLDLITFFTIGPKEAHAWNCKVGSSAPQAAGKIHTDFERGFIRAEVIGYDDYVQHGGESGARDKGALRVEGKTYTMQDGDIVHFRFNV